MSEWNRQEIAMELEISKSFRVRYRITTTKVECIYTQRERERERKRATKQKESTERRVEDRRGKRKVTVTPVLKGRPELRWTDLTE